MKILLLLCVLFVALNAQNVPESVVQIRQFCGQNPAVGTWEKYVCDIVLANRTDDRCIPQRRFANGNKQTPAKGIIVMFHGYTACPQAFGTTATALQAAGFHVLSFLTVGHGRKFQDCPVGELCLNGDPIGELPTTRKGYVDFVKQATTIVDNERKKVLLAAGAKVHLMGLSLGSALATFSASLNPGLYDKVLLFAPFYGITVPALDRVIGDCANNVQQCITNFTTDSVVGLINQFGAKNNQAALTPEEISTINDVVQLITTALPNKPEPNQLRGGFAELQQVVRFLLVNVVENPSVIPVDTTTFVNGAFGWGSQCESDRVNQNRGGYCNFKVANLLAVHSFSQFALDSSRQVRLATSMFVTVERDGITRNSMAFQSGQNMINLRNSAQACMFLVTPNCNLTGDNVCGVPHSLLAEPDNLGLAPFVMYWLPGVVTDTVTFFSTPAAKGFGKNSGDRAVCITQNVVNPNPLLVGSIPKGLALVLDAGLNALNQKVQNLIIEQVANASGIPDYWLIALTNFAESVDGVVVSFEMPPAAIKTLTQRAKIGQFSNVAGFNVKSITEDGEDTVLIASGSVMFPSILLVAFLCLILG